MDWYVDINPSNKSGNQYISIPAWDITGDFTIEIDCEIYNTTGTDADGFVFSGGNASGGFELYRDGAVQSYRPSLWRSNSKNLVSPSDIWPYVNGSIINPRRVTIQRIANTVMSNFDGVAGSLITINGASNVRISAIGARPGGSYTLGLRLYKIKFIWSGGTRTYNPSLGSGSGVIIPTEEGGNEGTFINPPADNAQWVSYTTGATQSVTIPAAKQQDAAAVVSVEATQSPTVPAAKQQDVSPTVTVSTTQTVTVPAAKQQDVAPTITVGATQVLAVAGVKQQDKATAVTVGTSQLVTVPAAKQQDVAAAVTVAQVAPGSQPVTIPAVKQQDTSGVVVVGTTQVVAVAASNSRTRLAQ